MADHLFNVKGQYRLFFRSGHIEKWILFFIEPVLNKQTEVPHSFLRTLWYKWSHSDFEGIRCYGMLNEANIPLKFEFKGSF